MSKKVFLKLKGGLGNQLFQLAAGLSLVQSTDKSLVLLTGRYIGSDRRFYELARFEKSLNITSKRCLNPMKLPLQIKEFKEFEYQKLTFHSSRDLTIDGYFQNPEYVRASLRAITKAVLSQDGGIPKNNGCDCRKEHVGIHIRRGDYLLPENKKLFGVLDLQYFEALISEFDEAHISIFTDGEIDSLTRGKNSEIDVFGKEESAWQTLRSLASMDTIIISNSSLSWWAACIGSEMNMIQRVISPNQWFKGILSSNQLILENWEKRECLWIK